MAIINQIAYGGTVYEFADQTARDSNTALSAKVATLNKAQTDAIEAERQRASDAEAAIEATKVTRVAGKGLSTNDFTDEYKSKIENPKTMKGATEDEAGEQGNVPAPQVGDHVKFLSGAGEWAVPHDTTYDVVTDDTAGLMSAEEHKKLKDIDPVTDDMTSDHLVIGADGSITETLGNGKSVQTVFNADGSITQTVINSAGKKTILTSTFSESGIDRTVT